MPDQNVQTLSYSDLKDLSSALTTAVGGFLMSLEEAKAIWKRHLIQVGWKQVKPTTETQPENKDSKEVTK